MQSKFIQYLKEIHSNSSSFVGEVACTLDIGFDAAYRRINQKTNLTPEKGAKQNKQRNKTSHH